MTAAIRVFPDRRWEIEDVLAEGDRVAIRWSVTGKQVTVRGLILNQIEDGKIKKSWGE